MLEQSLDDEPELLNRVLCHSPEGNISSKLKREIRSNITDKMLRSTNVMPQQGDEEGELFLGQRKMQQHREDTFEETTKLPGIVQPV